MNAGVTYPPANTRRVARPRQTRRSEWPLRSAAPEVLLVPWSLRSSRGFRSSASAAGGRHQHTCNFCYLTVTRVHARIRVCVCVVAVLQRGAHRRVPWRPQRSPFPSPCFRHTHCVSLRTCPRDSPAPTAARPFQAGHGPPSPVRHFVPGAAAASRRGTGVGLWGEPERADGCAPREALCGNGVCGGRTPPPVWAPGMEIPVSCLGLDLSFLRSQTRFCTHVSGI